jgi:LuxR family maltose regulon positive regulatory protein
MALLKTKLHIPETGTMLVSRARLLNRLDDSQSIRLTLISAPAGFGKTTLVASWLAKQRCAWISLDEDDDDYVRFWTYATAAMQTLDPEIGKNFLATLESPLPHREEKALTLLLNDLDSGRERFVLVLDDLHTIASREIFESLSFFIEHLTPSISLVIATRKDPALPLARFRARGEMIEIRARDLRFSNKEVVDFLNNKNKLGLDSKQIGVLADKTEGWIAGLKLATLSLLTEQDKGAFLTRFAGIDRHVMDYLVEEVLDRQPAGIREFLISTSLLDRLSGPLCDFLIGEYDQDLPVAGNGKAVLEYLESINLFTESLDNERRWFRYHRLFADLLLFHLKDAHPQRLATLHKRACQWLEENGYLQEAMKHARALGDIELIADLLQKHVFNLLFKSETRLALAYLGLLPEPVIRGNPILAISHAWALTLAEPTGPQERVEIWLKATEEAVMEAEPALRNQMLGHIESIRAFLIRSPGKEGHEAARLIELSERANDLLPKEDKAIRCVNELNVGYARLEMAELGEAMRAYRLAYEHGIQGGNHYVAVFALHNQAMIAVARADLEAALQLCREGIDYFGGLFAQADSDFPALGCLYLMSAAILFERNRLTQAEEALARGSELIQWTGEYESQIMGHTTLTRLRLAQNDETGARDAIRGLERIWPAGDWYRQALSLEIDLWKNLRGDLDGESLLSRAQALQGELGQVEREIGIHPVGEARYRAYLICIQAESVKALEDGPEQFERLKRRSRLRELQERIQRCRELGLEQRVMQLSLQLSLFYLAAGETGNALGAFAPLLRQAERQGYLRSIVVQGRYVARLLEESAKAGQSKEYAGALRDLLRTDSIQIPAKPIQAQTASTRAGAEEPVEPLSQREVEVLALLAEGLANKAIGDRLFISPYTVRAHTFTIYGKLHVHNRTEAAARARKLGILS